MLFKRQFFLLALLVVIVSIYVFFRRTSELKPTISEIISAVVPATEPEAEVKNDLVPKPQTGALKPKPKPQPDTKALEPCFGYWSQSHRVKYFDKANYPRHSYVQKDASGGLVKHIEEITLENLPVGNLPKTICNLQIRRSKSSGASGEGEIEKNVEFFSVMLTTQDPSEKLVEITEAWLKPSGDELEVYRPDGSTFKKNQVFGFWGSLELDQKASSVKIKNCGAELGWALDCPPEK